MNETHWHTGKLGHIMKHKDRNWSLFFALYKTETLVPNMIFGVSFNDMWGTLILYDLSGIQDVLIKYLLKTKCFGYFMTLRISWQNTFVGEELTF